MQHNMKTLKTLTQLTIMDELTYLQGGSRVNHTAQQAKDLAQKTSATCGQRCCALFENAPRATSWAKMFAALLVGMEGWYSKKCALTWKLKGTPYNRLYFQLVPSTLPTDEIESGLLPTPTAFDYNTPRSQEAWDKAKEKHGDALQNPLKQMAAFGMLPTPVANDYKTRFPTKNWKGDADLPSVVNGQLGTRSQLSPLFVEEMMGFPKNWTALPFQSGDKKA